MIPHPCKPDCPKRTESCALTCSKWKLYVYLRDKNYRSKNLTHQIYNYFSNREAEKKHDYNRKKRR